MPTKYDPAYYQRHKEAFAAKQRRWVERHPEQARAIKKAYVESRGGRMGEHIRAYYKKYPERRFAKTIKTRYGLTVQMYEALVASQGGACAMCGKVGRLFIDHDHKTGAVRGLLCPGCNGALGHYEKPGWWELATAYLARPDPLAELTAALKAAKGSAA